jgi:Histone chaperone Rttp106-like
MASETPYLRAILPSLPNDFAKKIRILCSSSESSEHILDTLIRFLAGAESAPNSSPEARTQWTEKQQAVTKILDNMTRRSSADTKRPREDDAESESQAAKRQRPSADESSILELEDPVFTLHSVSVTSPVRKKVNITIHKSSLRFTNPSSNALEATVPLSSLTRTFLLPTRGKSKPHWTIVLLSSDTPDHGKSTNTSPSNPQVIFGLDAIASPTLTTTTYSSGEPTVETISKGNPTKSAILTFLSHLNIPILEPTPQVFKSACAGAISGVSANEDGVPGVEAYRGAKQGSLWFMKEGILWGESKPCEFWALENLIGKNDGLRIVSASGRTCTVVLTRKEKGDEVQGDDEKNGDDGEDVGEEAHFGMVDAREKPGIDAWVRVHRHLFGKKKEAGKITIGQIEDDSDNEDEDFEMKSEDDDDGSVSSSSSSESSDEGESESDEDAEESGEGEASGEELKEDHHPLMRPGAMPRMSRAAIDMVVGMMEEDMGSGTAGGQAESDNEEEDELED